MSDGEDLKEVEKQLKENDIVMITLPKANYSEKVMDIVKIIANLNKSICYVSVNRPEKTLVELFNENDIDRKKFLIIDCISSNVEKHEKGEGTTIFIKSPANLTELSLAVVDAIDSGLEAVFIDSLSTFIVYVKELIVVKFAHNIISKMRVSEKKGIFIVLKSDISTILFDDLNMFVDSVVEVM